MSASFTKKRILLACAFAFAACSDFDLLDTNDSNGMGHESDGSGHRFPAQGATSVPK